MQRILAVVVLSSLPACVLFEDTSPHDPPPNNGNPGGNPGGNPDPDPDCTDCESTIPLDFEGAQPVNPAFPDQANINNHIAVGGTHDVALEYENNAPFSYAYDADPVETDLLAVETTDGPNLTLRALRSGLSELRITEPTSHVLFDRAAYAMSEFSTAVAVGTEFVSSPQFGTPAASYVFAPGARVGVAYLNALVPANRLVDTSATLASAGATQTRWDEIAFDNATVGHHTVAVIVGSNETTVDVEIATTADTVETLFEIDTIACFGAFTHGAFLSGASWTYVVDGQPFENDPTLGGFGPNCVFLNTTGPHTITAAAAGKAVTITTTP